MEGNKIEKIGIYAKYAFGFLWLFSTGCLFYQQLKSKDISYITDRGYHIEVNLPRFLEGEGGREMETTLSKDGVTCIFRNEKGKLEYLLGKSSPSEALFGSLVEVQAPFEIYSKEPYTLICSKYRKEVGREFSGELQMEGGKIKNGE
jgi:hypothetical protein